MRQRHGFWICNACHTQNHQIDGECQYCECGGAVCPRDNCSDPRHVFQTEGEIAQAVNADREPHQAPTGPAPCGRPVGVHILPLPAGQGNRRAFDPHRPITNLYEARLVVARLHRHFAPKGDYVLAPVVQWTTRRRKGRALRSNIIVTGPQMWRGVTASLLHEYAHILAFSRRYQEHHGSVFYEVLVEVTTFWYGHTSQYSWGTEYRRLVRWAQRDGWLVPADEEAQQHLIEAGLLPAKGAV